MKNFAVLELFAGAYKTERMLKARVTHLVELKDDGMPKRVVCNGPQLDHVCIDCPSDNPPTCPKCLASWYRLHGEKP